jgi:hypothetical protein
LKNTLVFIVLFAVLAAVSTSGCLTSTKNAGSAAVVAEPIGGGWKPFVLNSGAAIRSPAPPSPGSAQYNQDLNELKTLQQNRTAVVNESITYWNSGSVVRWNEIARSLVAKITHHHPWIHACIRS